MTKLEVGWIHWSRIFPEVAYRIFHPFVISQIKKNTQFKKRRFFLEVIGGIICRYKIQIVISEKILPQCVT